MPAKPTSGALFRGFLLLGLTGFGGVLPQARQLLVEQRRWLSEAEFAETLGLCQFLPGGNVINLSLAVGLRYRGLPGALAAITGLLAAPCVIVVLLGTVYERFHAEPWIGHAFGGIAAAAAGLLLGLAGRMLRALGKRTVPLAVSATCMLAIAVLRLPLLPTLLVLAPVSILVARD